MSKNKIIQLKAAFLVVVFSVNTILGFACSLGFNMGYNAQHHQSNEEKPGIMKHPGGCEKSNTHQPIHPAPDSKKDDCCSSGVTSFNLLSKTEPKLFHLTNPVFVSFLVTNYLIRLLPHHHVSKNIRVFTQNYHPPIPDIRIAIQSFLI